MQQGAFLRRATLDKDIPDIVKEHLYVIFKQLQKYQDEVRLRLDYQVHIDYDDLFQELVIALLYEVYPNYEPSKGNFGALAWSSLKHKLFKLMRHQQYTHSLQEWASTEDVTTLLDAFDKVDSALAVYTFLLTLRQRERAILIAIVQDGLTQDEVAKRLGVTKRTVQNDIASIRLQYVQQALQEHIQLPRGL